MDQVGQPAIVAERLAGDGRVIDKLVADFVAKEFMPWQILGDEGRIGRSEEHTSELQSLMRISYAVFCLKKKTSLSCSRPTSIRQPNSTSNTHTTAQQTERKKTSKHTSTHTAY